MEHIPKKKHYARCPVLELFGIAYVVLSQKLWRALVYINWIDSHRPANSQDF